MKVPVAIPFTHIFHAHPFSIATIQRKQALSSFHSPVGGTIFNIDSVDSHTFWDAITHIQHRLSILISSKTAQMHAQSFPVQRYTVGIQVAHQHHAMTISLEQIRYSGNTTRLRISGGYPDNSPWRASGMSHLADYHQNPELSLGHHHISPLIICYKKSR